MPLTPAIFVLLILPPLIWSSQIVIGRVVLAEVPPFSLTFWSMLIAVIVLVLLGGKGVIKARQKVVEERWYLLMSALFGVTAFKSLYYFGVERTTAVNASMLGPALPIIIAVFAWLFLGERMSLRQVIGVVITVIGVITISVQGDLELLVAFRFNAGDLFIISAFAAMALYTMMLRRVPTALSQLEFITVIFTLATIMLVPFYLWELSQGSHNAIPWDYSVAVLYTGIVVYLLGIFFWNIAVARLGALLPGLFVLLIPVFGTGFAIMFLDEKVYWYHFTGVILIIAGLVLSTVGAEEDLNTDLQRFPNQ